MSDTKVTKGNVVVSEWSNNEIAYAVTDVGKVLFYAYPVDGKRSDLYSFSIDGTDWQVIAETVREYRKLATDHAAFLDRAASTRVMVKLSDRAEFLATVIGENTDDPDSYYHTYQIQERNGRIHWVRQNQTRKI